MPQVRGLAAITAEPQDPKTARPQDRKQPDRKTALATEPQDRRATRHTTETDEQQVFVSVADDSTKQVDEVE